MRPSTQQFVLKPIFVDIATILRTNIEDMPIVNTKVKVSRIEDSTTVGEGADEKARRLIYLTDATGSLKVAFWRKMALS